MDNKLDISKIKTVVFDMDGTLISSNRDIMPKTKKAIIELQNKGIHIILASGRPIQSMLKQAKELELDKHHGVILSNNGAIGFDTRSNELVFETPIDHETVVEILKSFKGRNIWPMIEDGDHFLVKDKSKGVVQFKGQELNITKIEAEAGNYGLKEVNPIEDHVDINVNKILTIVEPDEILEIVAEFKDKFEGKVHVVQTSPYYMEFVRPEANKAYGLKKLNIEPETTMVFGDSMNDLEMLVYAKYPIAMGNAQPPLKEAAYYVTDDNDNEGIYKAFKHFGFVK